MNGYIMISIYLVEIDSVSSQKQKQYFVHILAKRDLKKEEDSIHPSIHLFSLKNLI